MLRIGEFSKLTQVSVRMLRYYDEAGLLKPAYTDPATGYRMYTARQVPILQKILFLRDTGFGVAEIADALPRWSDEYITGLLLEKQRQVQQAVQAEQDRLAKIHMALRDIRQAKMAVHYNVSVKNVPACRVLGLRRVIPDYYGEGLLWKELAAFARATGAQTAQTGFAIYHDLDYRDADVDVEVCAPVTSMGRSEGPFVYRETEPVAFMASALVQGPFENIAGAFYSIAEWLAGHEKYSMPGTSRQIVHQGPWNEDDPAKYLTEIQIPLELKKSP